MSTHPITAELRQQAKDFHNADHPDYRKHENEIHHEVRGHTIDAINSSLKAAERDNTATPIERLERDMDTFTHEVASLIQELQGDDPAPNVLDRRWLNVEGVLYALSLVTICLMSACFMSNEFYGAAL